jgi:CubicO group peptidase (beta-lactamase class C family)
MGYISGYGFQWWTSAELNGFLAEGYQGQVIFVNPANDLVITFTARTSDMPPHQVIADVLAIMNNITGTIISWITILSFPSIIIVLIIFRKKINRPKTEV